ncbi:MAG: hybrid sensor histidine kinase/response regulator [Bacteroidetes bacterium]|nr:hybrid sensor histidine kinase/response regulator [Bacteroidota bacterium]
MNSILLVDDDETFLDIAQPILESNSFEVKAYRSVESAESALNTFTPDLIISDVEMPGRNGFDFFENVHRIPALQNVPFIFLTANSDVDSVATGKELGSDDYLTKPVNYKLLLATVKGKLKKKESLQSAQSMQIEEIKGQLFRMISHEMRTPLTSIVGATEILADPDSNFSATEMTTFLEMLQSNSRRLTSMFDDFLLVTRIESGEINSTLFDEVQNFNPHALVDSLLFPLQNDMLQRRIKVKNKCQERETTVCIYPTHLESILFRLIDNAVKFSPIDSTVTVDSKESQGTICFRITDTGRGIPAEALEKVFEKFHQVDRETNEQQGSGLGLYITKKLTERYRGNIWFESELTKGTTFHVEFPKFHLS